MLKLRLKHSLIGFLFSISFLLSKNIYAAGPPILISPPDNSIGIQSPKLVWEYIGECVQSGSCFRVEVDESENFADPQKSTYTNNLNYSPQGLSDGLWNWRVKAKDQTGNWSEWSNVFKFTMTAQSAEASPTNPDPQTTTTPQPSPLSSSSKKPSGHFEIKDIPSEINSDQEFDISVSLNLPEKTNTGFYLKGAFKKSDSSNYFGFTLNGDWVKNNSSYSNQYKIPTDSEGKWAGKIKVRPDSLDSGFDGSGNYILKVGRYSDSGSGPVWSNELNIKINEVKSPSLSPSEKPEDITEEEEKIDLSASLVKTPENNYIIKIASVAGEATKSDNINPSQTQITFEDSKINWLLVILGLGILSGGAGFTYLKIKKEKFNANI